MTIKQTDKQTSEQTNKQTNKLKIWLPIPTKWTITIAIGYNIHSLKTIIRIFTTNDKYTSCIYLQNNKTSFPRKQLTGCNSTSVASSRMNFDGSLNSSDSSAKKPLGKGCLCGFCSHIDWNLWLKYDSFLNRTKCIYCRCKIWGI